MDPLPYVQARADGSSDWVGSITLPIQSAEDVRLLLNRWDGAFGAGHPRFRWNRLYTAGQLSRALAAAGQGDALPKALRAVSRGPLSLIHI